MKNKIVKTNTDLSQSKRLAEILPLESADLDYIPVVNLEGEYSLIFNVWNNEHEDSWIPCWSLAALLDVLPFPSLHKTLLGYRCDSYNKEGTTCKLGESTDNPIDSCYEMILKLHELKML